LVRGLGLAVAVVLIAALLTEALSTNKPPIRAIVSTPSPNTPEASDAGVVERTGLREDEPAKSPEPTLLHGVPHQGFLTDAQETIVMDRIARSTTAALLALQDAAEHNGDLRGYNAQAQWMEALAKYDAARELVAARQYLTARSRDSVRPTRTSGFDYVIFMNAVAKGDENFDVIVPIPLKTYPDVAHAVEVQRHLAQEVLEEFVTAFNGKPLAERRRFFEERQTRLDKLKDLSARVGRGDLSLRAFADETRALGHGTMLPQGIELLPDGYVLTRRR
jgi:hypothetical protein